MVYYEDLLKLKYIKHGRDIHQGVDCYGFVLELYRRNGTPIADVLTDFNYKNYKTLKTNLEEIDKPRYADMLYTHLDSGEPHLGFMLNSKTVLHMTENGAQLVPVFVFNKPTFYRIKK